MEAWEVAEWEGREAQIRAMQGAQLKEFEDSIKAKHAQVLRPTLMSCDALQPAQCSTVLVLGLYKTSMVGNLIASILAHYSLKL